jgi:DNA replication protein DnaC
MAELANVTRLLKELSLKEAANKIDVLAADAAVNNMTPLDVLEILLKCELEFRNKSNIEKRIKAANFPYEARIEEFDFSNKELGITRNHMNQLLELSWLQQAYNIMFLGPPGLGKTFLSIALGLKAIDAGYRVYFVTIDELMKIIKTAEISTKSSRRLKQIRSCDLLVLDEVGFLPISRQEANHLYELVNSLYLQTSIIITSNKGFEEWSDFLGDSTITAAILDRLAHQCEIFSMRGPSWRIEHRKTILDRNIM